MAKYLGETIIEDLSTTEFKNYTKEDWAMYYIERYSQIDGAHHKQWVLDQVARIIKGCTIQVKLAEWDNGEEEYRVNVIDESQDYKDWVQEWEDDGYDYDPGIAP